MGRTVTVADFEDLFGVNAAYVEKLLQDFLAEPDAVGEEWRRFFVDRMGLQEPSRAEPAPRRDGSAGPAAGVEPLGGIAARIAQNMAESLAIPTATSTRTIPVKVLEENRRIVNDHLAGEHRGKTSFTHYIAWALIEALRRVPAMAVAHAEVDGRPARRRPQQVNLGIAVDVPRKDGARQLLVPNVKDCFALDFAGFVQAYDAQIDKARAGRLAPADFQDTTCTLTNPGTIGTVSSLPRLMLGQGFILATGAIELPAEYQGASAATLNELGLSKVMTVTSTYDHRVIQGADSGELLAWIHRFLVGEEGFYERIFADLRVPYRPVRFLRDRRAALGTPTRLAENQERAARVMQYIRAYRVRGYLLSNLDPLQYVPVSWPELERATYGLTLWDLDREFFSGGMRGKPFLTLREIEQTLRATYTRHVGVEFMHIADPEQKNWLTDRMEGNHNEEELPRATMLRVLDKLVEAEAFERFLHTRFVGHKRFSLEGGESLIPALDALLNRAAEHGVSRAVLGMAHRGRLNVLVHVLGKPLQRIFSEFEGYIDPESTQGSGDVKYHLGMTGRHRAESGAVVELELASNPSHLEAVDPVVEGIARAHQEAAPDGDGRAHVLPVLIHGDAAFAGQGVVAETLNMSQLRGYRTGGTVHLIVNNQIGYTTLPADARSTPYCTDIAKAIQAPIFHVNGDDPLAVVRMVRLAMDYRQKFHRDVVVDIVCYRRHGHNEGDEPSYTQPLLYRQIEAHPGVRETYQQFLLRAKVIEPDDVARSEHALQQRLRESLDAVRASEAPHVERPPAAGEPEWDPEVATAVPVEQLVAWTDRLSRWPDGFSPHPKIELQLERRRKMIAGEQPVDFALAEQLAFASVLAGGQTVRLAGQDSARGTFSQRHSVLMDVVTGDKHVPLNFLAERQAKYVVIDSLLSEEAALGFEYGYSVARPESLTIWEAQFGDFGNGAQIQIDQFLAAGEAKWGQASGLVLLLPHGYDGQGPEHSSARLERFLQLCAEGNLRVANPSTPAQYFHLLRRQALDPLRKPLVVMTPKSLLRLRAAGSAPEQLAGGGFAAVLDDPSVEPDAVRRVVLCSGKLYYELHEARAAAPDAAAIGLVRVELLYPWPASALERLVARYGGAADWVWAQEEPANMGAWVHARLRWRGPELRYAGRPAAASPATGSLVTHKAEQGRLIADALGA
jgi:2-oxoglutarate dehydrogenase E1 component